MELQRISAQVRRAYRGEAWHGAGLTELLAGVDADGAAARPIAGAHSIWELVLHVAGWAREVAWRLDGGEPGLPPAGDWPDPGEITEQRWVAARAELGAAHEALVAAVNRFDESRLDLPVTTRTDTGTTTGASFYDMLHGLMQHDAYHGGQIALLKKSLAAQPPPGRGLQEVGQIAVTVHDLDRAVAFYRDVLGLSLLMQTPKMAFVACGGVRLMLSLPETPEFDHPSSIIYYKVDDIQVEHERLVERNVSFRGPPHRVAELRDRALWMAFFDDSEGNLLALMSEVPRPG